MVIVILMAEHYHVEYLIYTVGQQLGIELYIHPAVPVAQGRWRQWGILSKE